MGAPLGEHGWGVFLCWGPEGYKRKVLGTRISLYGGSEDGLSLSVGAL